MNYTHSIVKWCKFVNIYLIMLRILRPIHDTRLNIIIENEINKILMRRYQSTIQYNTIQYNTIQYNIGIYIAPAQNTETQINKYKNKYQKVKQNNAKYTYTYIHTQGFYKAPFHKDHSADINIKAKLLKTTVMLHNVIHYHKVRNIP